MDHALILIILVSFGTVAGTGPAAQESGTSTPLLASPLPPSTDLFVYAESQQNIPPMLKALQDFVLKKFVEVIWEQIELEDMEPSVVCPHF